jgi:transcriptional regulator of NAD metabolism
MKRPSKVVRVKGVSEESEELESTLRKGTSVCNRVSYEYEVGEERAIREDEKRARVAIVNRIRLQDLGVC